MSRPFSILEISVLSLLSEKAVTSLLKVAAPAADISRVRAVIVEPPSFPLKIRSLSETFEPITASLELLDMSKIEVPSSLNTISPPSASRTIPAPQSMVNSPASDIVEPFIVISSTVKVVKVPSDVTLA